MESLFEIIARHVALAAEASSVLAIAVGLVETIVRTAGLAVWPTRPQRQARREVWTRFAGWIVLALEFALAADIVRTAIAPSWDDIGRLAAIAVIRTGLNYFLEKDIEVFEASDEDDGGDDRGP